MSPPEDLVEEFLLRLPSSEPASLVRVALVCKRWCRLISSPRFRRRFRAFHRTPPMLGFICNTSKDFGPYVARFVPTSSFRPRHADHRDWLALDARHGYVLLRSVDSGQRLLVVWDPITDERWQLPPLALPPLDLSANVLCSRASGAGDHLDCLHGTFLVVLVYTGSIHTTLRVYTSVSGCWSQQTVVYRCLVDEMSGVLVGNTIYFSIDLSNDILSYDLSTRDTSVIHLPPNCSYVATALMTMEDGGLGIARADGGELCLWSMDTSSNGDIGWTQTRVIELETLLPANALPISSTFIVSAPGTGVLFVHGYDGLLFTIDLKSDEVKKVRDNDEDDVVSVVPYVSFYTPEFRACNR